MSFKKFFSLSDALDIPDKEMENQENESNDRIRGKIIHIESDKGWGFITSEEVPFTRIFFHWSALVSNTLNFTELKKYMKVEFVHKIFDGNKHRAIKIKVINDSEGTPPNT